MKDVLQHWPNRAVSEFLPVIRRYPYALITNCVNPDGVTANDDVPAGGCRSLDLRRPPFRVAAEVAFSFTNYRSPLNRLWCRPRWRKLVLLIRSPAAGAGED